MSSESNKYILEIIQGQTQYNKCYNNLIEIVISKYVKNFSMKIDVFRYNDQESFQK